MLRYRPLRHFAHVNSSRRRHESTAGKSKERLIVPWQKTHVSRRGELLPQRAARDRRLSSFSIVVTCRGFFRTMLQASKTLVRVPAASLGALVRTPNRTLTMRSRAPAPASRLAAPGARSLSTYMREQYLPDSWEIPPLEERSNRVDVSKTRLQRHWDDAAWDEAALRDAQRSHVNATWGPGNSLDGVPFIKHADGCNESRVITWQTRDGGGPSRAGTPWH